jgi:hypothetical protein
MSRDRPIILKLSRVWILIPTNLEDDAGEGWLPILKAVVFQEPMGGLGGS